MALITCPECQQSVSSIAKSCPKCGYPIAGSGTTQQHFGEVEAIEASSETALFETRGFAGCGTAAVGFFILMICSSNLELFPGR